MNGSELETKRNAWVAEQIGGLTGPELYRDDNCFCRYDDPDGAAVAFIVFGADEQEVLVRNSEPYDTICNVPVELWLGVR